MDSTEKGMSNTARGMTQTEKKMTNTEYRDDRRDELNQVLKAYFPVLFFNFNGLR